MKTVELTIKWPEEDLGNDHLWHVSRDLWQQGYVTSFLKEQVTGLKDVSGEPLPDHAKEFIMDIFFQRIKLPKTTKRGVSAHAVRQVFKVKLQFYEFEKFIEQREGIRGTTPSQEALLETARIFNVSESVVSRIIYPRRAIIKREK